MSEIDDTDAIKRARSHNEILFFRAADQLHRQLVLIIHQPLLPTNPAP